MLFVFNFSTFSSACAQYSVVAKSQLTGERIDAVVYVKNEDGKDYLGRTTVDAPYQGTGSCDGMKFAAKPIATGMYLSKSEFDEWNDCETTVEIFFDEMVFLSSVETEYFVNASNFSQAAGVSPDEIILFNQALYDQDPVRTTLRSKAIAEALESSGYDDDAEIFWALSAQSAVTFFSREIGSDEEKNWLSPVGNKYRLNDEAVQVIMDYQRSTSRAETGVISKDLFSWIENNAETTQGGDAH